MGTIAQDTLKLAKSLVASKLRLKNIRIDRKATDGLRKMKLRARSGGDLTGAILSAGYYAQKNDKSCYVYPGNSYGNKVWRATFKENDALNPINNTGSGIFIVEPDLTVKVADVER